MLHKIKLLWNWIIGMLYNIFLDFLILILGIFLEQIRYLYIRQFYPDLSKDKQESEG